jgi:alkanesulfonate monooxygenase SsuD/methylene tetrahydromethanopterin reductase-like flavin-dependent oxidoreductase (luciferase family)
MELAAVALSPVPDGGTAADASANTVEAAQQAEQLGLARFWVAEHHGMADALDGLAPSRPRRQRSGDSTLGGRTSRSVGTRIEQFKRDDRGRAWIDLLFRSVHSPMGRHLRV